MNTAGKELLLELKDVHAAYVKKEVLRGMSLTVGCGEIVALLGGNGSGKSTTLKTIAGLLRPSSGNILLGSNHLNKTNITNLSVHARQAMGIGYLLQAGKVFPNLTVSENIWIAANHAKKLNGDSSRQLGSIFPALETRASVRAGLLSGGQRQMLAIEMVMAQNPLLLLLDEPTGALSPDLAQSILQTIAEYVRTSGCAVLLVEQNVKEAIEISNRCFQLEEGKAHDFVDKQTGRESE